MCDLAKGLNTLTSQNAISPYLQNPLVEISSRASLGLFALADKLLIEAIVTLKLQTIYLSLRPQKYFLNCQVVCVYNRSSDMRVCDQV